MPADDTTPATVASRPVKPPARPRNMWQGSPTFNAALGVFMLAAGVAFTAFGQKGISVRDRALLLLAYVVLAGFYFFRAYRGYRKQRTGQ